MPRFSRIATLLGFLFLTAVLTGPECACEEPDDSDLEPISLRMDLWERPSIVNTYRELAEEYGRQTPGIHVQVKRLSSNHLLNLSNIH